MSTSDGSPLPEVELSLDVVDGSSEGAWRPVHFTARETLSQIYEASVVLSTTHLSADIDELFEKSVGVEMVRSSLVRNLRGWVRRVEDLGTTGSHRFARVQIVPQLFKLSHRVNSRIWQHVNVITVVREVLKDAGIYQGDGGVELGAGMDLPAREYCVQYRESDLDFVMRILQEEGVSFFFKHEGPSETLVLAGESHAWEQTPTLDGGAVEMQDAGVATAAAESMQWFDWHRKTHPTGVTLRDFDFTHPRSFLEFTSKAPGDVGARGVYDYPARFNLGDYNEGGHAYSGHHGGRIARIRNEENRFDEKSAHGRSNVTGLMPGLRFTLGGHVRAELDGDWLVTEITHEAIAWGDIPSDARSSEHMKAILREVGGVSEREEGASSGRYETRYTNSFVGIPTAIQYRPPRITPRPLVYGAQTATVMAEPGTDDEICVDFHGRILVRFHWERPELRTGSQRGKNASCWIRVAQMWAGSAWGAMFIPRVGMEVVVTFLEGDPDRPLVTGCVYNGVNNTPYPLPEEKTKSTIKTSTTPGGDGFNELRFEDLKDREQIFIHAQRDHDIVVRRDNTLYVGNDRQKTVQGYEKNTVVKDRTTEIQGTERLLVQGDRNVRVNGGKGYAINVVNNLSINGDASVKLTCGGSSIEMLPDKITIASKTVHVLGTSLVNIDGKLVTINCGNNPGGAKKSGLEMFATQAMELQGTPGGVLERIKQALDAGKLAETLSKSADKLLTKLGLPPAVRERLSGLVKGVGGELIAAVKEGRKPNFGKIINEEQITGLVKSGVDSVFGPLAEKVKNNKVLSGLVKEAQGVVTTAATWGTLHAAGINTGLAKDPLWSVLKQRHGESVRNFLAENANAAAKQVLDRYVQKHGNTPFLQKVEKQLLKGAEKGIQKGLDRILGPRPN